MSIRFMNFTLMFSLFGASSALSQDVSQQTASSLAASLQRPYENIYPGVQCSTLAFQDRWYLKCSPGEIVGGLWAVAPGPVLIPMNGKAQSHAEKIGTVYAEDGTEITVSEWRDIYPNEIPDVSSVLAQF